MNTNLFLTPFSFRNIDWKRFVKLAVGTIISILLAQLLELQYAYSAGIITLLTIQDTKRETVQITVKRVLIFILMTFLSVIVFQNIGYTMLGFSIILFPYLLICMVLNMKEAIAPIAVLCTHYISSTRCDFFMFCNELGLLVIGAGIGIILNLFYMNNIETIHERQYQIEDRMKKILEKMALYITMEDKSHYKMECFSQLDDLLKNLKTESINYINNRFLGQHDYYYEYMDLRLMQCNLLKQIYTDICRLDMIFSQVQPISDFLLQLSRELHEYNNVESLLLRLQELESFYDQSELPKTREEFKSRALLYHILKDLEKFVKLKRSFYIHIKNKE